MNERWCRMCIQSTGWVYSPLWHRSRAKQTLQVLGTHFCRVGAWKKHHSFLYAPVPTFPSTGKEEAEAEAKSESEERKSLCRYLGSIFLIQELSSAGMKIIHRWPGKLMKIWHILELLYDRVWIVVSHNEVKSLCIWNCSHHITDFHFDQVGNILISGPIFLLETTSSTSIVGVSS